MLRLTAQSVTSFANSLPPSGAYFLSEVRMDIPDPLTVIFKAKLHGPVGSPVWTRAWVSTQIDGTLAEVASPQMAAGDEAVLTVKLKDGKRPDHAYMRIESAPLCTEHVVSTELVKSTQ